MRNVLLVEPDYRSKFPPLGLMRLSTYHRGRGDAVTFVRGLEPSARMQIWDRVYVSSLFTWELPRTVATLQYYRPSVRSTDDLVAGGVGVTLLPDYVKENSDCRILTGLADIGSELDPGSPPLDSVVPDYRLLDGVQYPYTPTDAYFVRITKGCVRSCKFCAVPILEPRFSASQSLRTQIEQVNRIHGERQNMVVLDNNLLGLDTFEAVVEDIQEAGFSAGSKRNGRLRNVDFNQGLDCRLIDDKKAKLLATLCAKPIRLAFDFDGVEKSYRAAIKRLAANGFLEFTNYVLFNFNDDPESLYHRLSVNLELNRSLSVRISAFPMRFIPMNDVNRRHIGKKWSWRYLRGIQCVLLATYGLVSPNPKFFNRAFGGSVDEFKEILSMPDRYIIFREAFETRGADDWKIEYGKLSSTDRLEFFGLLEELNLLRGKARTARVLSSGRFRAILEHYFPKGNTPPMAPPEADLEFQGLTTDYSHQN